MIPAVRRPAALMLGATLLTATLVGCTESSASTSAAKGSHYPVTLLSCGKPVTVPALPTRLVTNDINMAEMALTLGLAPAMAGIAGVSSRDELLPALRSAAADVPTLAEDYISMEPLVGAKADFLFAGWNYGLSASDGITPESLASKGITTYALTESCAHVTGKKRVDVRDVFTDLRALGDAFDVRAAAEALVKEQEATLARVADQVKGKRVVPVFVYDSGEDSPFTAPGLAMPTDLIRRAGGHNVFEDLAKTWTTVSWEQVVSRAPECVVIVDYGDVTAAQKRAFLERRFPDLPAVKNRCIASMPYAAATPGVRSADAVASIAALLDTVR